MISLLVYYDKYLFRLLLTIKLGPREIFWQFSTSNKQIFSTEWSIWLSSVTPQRMSTNWKSRLNLAQYSFSSGLTSLTMAFLSDLISSQKKKKIKLQPHVNFIKIIKLSKYYLSINQILQFKSHNSELVQWKVVKIEHVKIYVKNNNITKSSDLSS